MHCTVWGVALDGIELTGTGSPYGVYAYQQTEAARSDKRTSVSVETESLDGLYWVKRNS